MQSAIKLWYNIFGEHGGRETMGDPPETFTLK